MVDPWDADDYRALLRAWMADKPQQRSIRAVARRVGSSPARLSMICQGERDLGVEEAGPWATALGFPEEVAAAFDALVRAEHAPSVGLRRAARRELAARRRVAQARRIDREDAAVLDDPVAVVVAELARLPDFRPDPAWIASRLWPRVAVEEAREALDVLLHAGVVRLDGDRVEVDDRALATAAEIAGAEAARQATTLHQEVLSAAARSLDERTGDHRSVVTLTVALPADRLGEVVAALNQTLLEAVTAARAAGPPDEVVQIAISVVRRTGPA